MPSPNSFALWGLLAYTAVASPTTHEAPTVKLANGTLAGTHNPGFNQDFFLGVPFAAPPVDDLRLRMPVPPAAWNGTRMADSYGPWCMGNSLGLPGFSQNQSATMSEDCLHLNVIRPGGTPKDGKLPVLVWIHGGAFEDGSAGDGRYNGSFLVQNSVKMETPIIFVSFNYRLGVFGMMNGRAVEDAGLANLLLHDQRQALAWIQENIRNFGGDASRVTIMGESSGATSIGHLLTAYGGRDGRLFSAAIAESGGPLYTTASRNVTEREADFNMVLATTGCIDAKDSLDCLRSVPAESLRRASQKVPASITIDGGLVPDCSWRLLQTGQFLKVPLLIGTNRNEGTSVVQNTMSSPLNTTNDLARYMTALNAGRALPDHALQNLSRLYQDEIESMSPAGLGTVLADPGPKRGPQYGKATLYAGDFIFIAGRRYANQVWADHGVPSYSYLFDTVTANVDTETLGAAHFQEIPFVFGNVDGVGWDVSPFPAEPQQKKKYEKLAQVMSHMWISFAVTESPNSHKGCSSCLPTLDKSLMVKQQTRSMSHGRHTAGKTRQILCLVLWMGRIYSQTRGELRSWTC